MDICVYSTSVVLYLAWKQKQKTSVVCKIMGGSQKWLPYGYFNNEM